MSPPLSQSNDVVIRSIEPTDLDRILQMNQANVPEVGSVDSDRMAYIVAESPIALVADVGDQVVGFCLVLADDSAYDSVNYRWFTQRYDKFMYLDRVAVDSSARGRGVGSALYVEVGRRMAAIDGADNLALEVNVDPPNETSLAFHASLGFTEVGQQDTPYGIRVSMQMRPTPGS
jgi:predicted GNAT superfamily acetyltransferase